MKNQWNPSPNEADHFRRSIYVFARRNLRYPVFEAFDRPDGNASCPDRSESTTAPQSLLLLNSEFSLDLARRFAGRVLKLAPDDVSQQIEFAVRIAFGRAPSVQETQLLATFIDSHVAALRSEGRPAEQLALPYPAGSDGDMLHGAALTDLCLALFNANEFLYID